MCGIVGYVGYRSAPVFLIEGLHRLEYRGYDSAGVAIHTDSGLEIRKKAGRVSQLEEAMENSPIDGTVGIGHTRWATHGETTDTNSHPHFGGNAEVALVHNGVIENYATLRNQLQELGYVFHSQTDTEVVAHLIAHHVEERIKLGDNPEDPKTYARAVRATTDRLKGTYGLAILFKKVPGLLIASRAGSPLVIGVGDGEFFIASDASPLVGYTKDVVYLQEHELVTLTSSEMHVEHRDNGRVSPSVQTLEQVEGDSDLGEYEHYMLKEIYEQPQAIENALRCLLYTSPSPRD